MMLLPCLPDEALANLLQRVRCGSIPHLVMCPFA